MKLLDRLFELGILPIELPALDRRAVVLGGLLLTIVVGLFTLGFVAGAHYCERRVTAVEDAGPTFESVIQEAERAAVACARREAEQRAVIRARPRGAR